MVRHAVAGDKGAALQLGLEPTDYTCLRLQIMKPNIYIHT